MLAYTMSWVYHSELQKTRHGRIYLLSEILENSDKKVRSLSLRPRWNSGDFFKENKKRSKVKADLGSFRV